jgi:pyruvate dehydrogenase E2 component (dihydrolipoamide acetyltransferase)
MASRVVMPKLTDTMEEGLIIRWYKQEGDPVESGDPLAEIETDKAVMDLEAYASGILRKILVPAETKVPAGALIAVIAREDEDVSDVIGETPARAAAAAKPAAPAPAGPKPGETARPAAPPSGFASISPRARQLADQEGLDWTSIQGSGPEGLITERDVRAAADSAAASGAEFEPAELSPMRATIARRMTQSKKTVPHFYVTVEIAMERALEIKNKLDGAGTRVTVTDLLIRAAALTLREFPQINSAYGGRVARRFKNVHIGIAVGLKDGILTPVVRDADQKSLVRIAAETRDLIERAKSRKLQPEEYTGSTFSLSNLGMFDVEDFIAIIQPGEGAVLAVGSIREVPVVADGGIRPGRRLKTTLSSDHRVIDGLLAAQFLQAFKKRIESGEIE